MRLTIEPPTDGRNRAAPRLWTCAWEGLFADLEGQLAAEQRRELDDEVAERTRRERALVTLHAGGSPPRWVRS